MPHLEVRHRRWTPQPHRGAAGPSRGPAQRLRPFANGHEFRDGNVQILTHRTSKHINEQRTCRPCTVTVRNLVAEAVVAEEGCRR